MQHFPCQCLDRRGRNVYPRQSHCSCGYVPRRSASLPETRCVCSGGSSRRPAGIRSAIAGRPSWAAVAVRPCTIASSASLSNGRGGSVCCLHRAHASCQNRLATRGRAIPPCGGPFPRSVKRPSSAGAGACSHRSMERTLPWSCACFFTARIRRAWARLSQKPWISRSMPQSSCPQRGRVCPTAAHAAFPGRYP